MLRVLAARGFRLLAPALRAVSNVAGGLVAYLWFKRGTWRNADLTERKGRTKSPTSATND
jgi:hypothetical protein